MKPYGIFLSILAIGLSVLFLAASMETLTDANITAAAQADTEAYAGAVGGSQELRVGGSYNADRLFDGWIDEVRISKGTARYTGNFTPSTSAFDVKNVTIEPDGTDYILGLTDTAGDGLISNTLGNILYLRWTGHNWMVDKVYGTWTDNN